MTTPTPEAARVAKYTEMKCPCGFYYKGYDPEMGERVFDDHRCTAAAVAKATKSETPWHQNLVAVVFIVAVAAVVMWIFR